MLTTNTPLIWLFQSYWRDEAFSVLLAQKPLVELVNITARDFSPPLYYLALKFWIIIFGSNEIATRSFSVLAFMMLFTLLLWYFKKVEKLSILKIAIIALTILLSPTLTYYAFETRMYAWAATFAVGSWLALFRKKNAYFVLITTLGLYTHYFQLLITFSQFVFIIISQRLEHKKSSEYLESFLKPWGMSFIKIGLLFLPWIIYVVVSHSSTSSSFWIKKPSFELVLNTAAVLITGYEKDLNIKFGLSGLSIPVYMLIIASGFSKLNSAKKIKDYFQTKHFAYTIWFLFPATLIAILSIFGPSLYLPRYLIVSSPALFFFIAKEINRKRMFFSAILMAIIIFQMKNYQDMQIKYRTKEDVRKIFTVINNITKEDDVLYLESELDYHLAQYYFKNPTKVFVVGKPYSELPPYVGKSMIPESHVSINRPHGESGIWLKSDRSTPKIVQP